MNLRSFEMKQMDDSTKSGSRARLEVSVSFGRFENDTLSWEKWSSFSPNKYMEEVGTLSTPGSVAQKKAYFEAHYKKIAAKKAEEMEQEKSTGSVNRSPDLSIEDDPIGNSSDNSAGLVEEVAEEACLYALAMSEEANNDIAISSDGDEQGACTNAFVDANTSEEIEYAAFSVQSGASAVEESKDVMNVNVGSVEVNVGKDRALVGLETPQKNSQHVLEEPPQRKNGIKQSKNEVSKANARRISSKVTSMEKERNLARTMKKVVSPPKYTKPMLNSRPVPASQASKKKADDLTPPKSKNSQMGESKRAAAPTSVHMSLSLGPTDSFGALSMTRKSLIMERMGDKDIVKRAFKTFQNRTNASIANEKPSPVKNVPPTAFEPKMSSYHTTTKGKEGPKKDAEMRASQKSQTGTRSNPLPSRSHKSSPLIKKSTMAISPVTDVKSDEKAEKRKEFVKKLGAKSIAREAENARIGAKSKVGVVNGTRRMPTLNP